MSKIFPGRHELISEYQLLIDFSARQIFCPTSEGYSVRPHLSPQLRRASYVSAGSGIDIAISAAQQSFVVPQPETILWLVQPSDAPPIRSARVFKRKGYIQHKVKAASGKLLEKSVESYVSTSGGYAWETDLEREIPGYFMTGRVGAQKLWRVTAIEKDPFDYDIVTLLPITLAGGFPQLQLPPDIDSLWKGEIEKQYEALQLAVRDHRYRAVVNEAKNLGESLLPIKLGQGPSANFASTLSVVKSDIEQAEKNRSTPTISRLTYHLPEKLRYLHQFTHTGGTLRKGRPLTPEFALTAAQDAIEVLRDLGYARG